jgi:hypothetical protein
MTSTTEASMTNNRLQQLLPYLLLGFAVIASLFSLGFIMQQPWALAIWPWQIARLSIFLIAASILASAASVLWIGLSRKFAALAPATLDVGIMYLGMAIFTFQLYMQDNSRQPLLVFALVATIFAVMSLGFFLWSLRIPSTDTRPTPNLVRISFGIFALALGLVGGMLVLKTQNVLPWPINAELSVMYGWFFIGSAAYFIYGILRPAWSNAQGQLFAFLAYDLVLIIPFIQHFGTVAESLRLSLIIYTAIVLYSAILAIYYLFINKTTRFVFAR